jgi:ribonuclease HI
MVLVVERTAQHP